jgi:hypothetical protein
VEQLHEAERVRHRRPAEASDVISHDVGEVLSEEEIDLAIADVQCKIDVRLVYRWSLIDPERQSELLTEHSGILDEYAALRAVLLESAAAIDP